MCPPICLLGFFSNISWSITSVHKPGETHVIALILHALEPFTPWQGIQGYYGKNVPHVCHRPVSLGHKGQSSGAFRVYRPALSEKWKTCLNQVDVARHPAKKNPEWKANCDSESWGVGGGSPCSHLLVHREALSPSRSSGALAVPHGTHGSGCSPHHAHLGVDASHATSGSAHSMGQSRPQACARSKATSRGRGCVPLRHSLGCRNSFPEMHTRHSALVTFRNVPLPRIK